MNGKLKKNVGFAMIPFALIFLFEPGFTVLDPLPDFIGYAILCLAILNLADVSPRIMDAYYRFRRAILVNALRLLAIYLLQTVFLDNEHTVGVLLFSFVFSFAELVCLIPAYKDLFEGLLSLGMMQDGTAIYQRRTIRRKVKSKESGKITVITRQVGKNATEKLHILTVCFLFVKHLAMTLPEFTSLTTNQPYTFIALLRGMGVAIALPIGIWWLIAFCRYCISVGKDTPFIERVSSVYLDKTRDCPLYFVSREVLTGLSLMFTAFLLSLDFYADYINLLPDFFYYAILLLAAILLRNHSKGWKALLSASAFGILTSIVSHSSAVSFHSEFYPEAIRKSLDAYNAFYQMLALHGVDAFAFIITGICTLLVLRDVYASHSDLSITNDEKEIKELKGKFKLHSACLTVSIILAGLASVYYIYSQPFYYTYHWFFYYSTVIAVTVNLIFSSGFLFFLSHISGAVKSRYSRYL